MKKCSYENLLGNTSYHRSQKFLIQNLIEIRSLIVEVVCHWIESTVLNFRYFKLKTLELNRMKGIT